MIDLMLKNFLDAQGINLADLVQKAQVAVATFERLQKDVDFIKNHLTNGGTDVTDHITINTDRPGE